MTDNLSTGPGSFSCLHLENPMATTWGDVTEGMERKRGSTGLKINSVGEQKPSSTTKAKPSITKWVNKRVN